MKKVLVISLMVLSVFWAFMLTNTVYAVTAKNVVEADGSINGGIEGKIIELKKSEAKTLEDYKIPVTQKLGRSKVKKEIIRGMKNSERICKIALEVLSPIE